MVRLSEAERKVLEFRSFLRGRKKAATAQCGDDTRCALHARTASLVCGGAAGFPCVRRNTLR